MASCDGRRNWLAGELRVRAATVSGIPLPLTVALPASHIIESYVRCVRCMKTCDTLVERATGATHFLSLCDEEHQKHSERMPWDRKRKSRR